MGDLAEVITKGTTPTTLKYQFVEEGINFVKIESISSKGDFYLEKFQYITEECHDKLKRSQLQENDVLFSIAGALGRVALVPKNILPANTNQALALIRIKNKNVCLKYITVVLSSDVVKNQTNKQKQGVAQLNLSLKNISDLVIPLPPLETQQHMAKTLDLATEIIEGYRQKLTELEKLVQSVFYEMFGDPVENEKGWEVIPWDNVFNVTTGKLDSNQMDINGEYPFFTCSKEILRINEYAFDCEALLLAGNNAAGIYDVKHYVGKFNAYQRTYVLTLKGDNKKYILFKILLEQKLNLLRLQSKGSSTKFLTMKILNNLAFILPPLPLQEQFAQIVEKIEEEKALVQEGLREAEQLFGGLLQGYFEG
ncbi:MAG: restriction endonuclease subunit S [Eubacteriales bacterium]